MYLRGCENFRWKSQCHYKLVCCFFISSVIFIVCYVFLEYARILDGKANAIGWLFLHPLINFPQLDDKYVSCCSRLWKKKNANFTKICSVSRLVYRAWKQVSKQVANSSTMCVFLCIKKAQFPSKFHNFVWNQTFFYLFILNVQLFPPCLGHVRNFRDGSGCLCSRV